MPSPEDLQPLPILKPERIIYPHEKLRIADLMEYYRLIAPRLLPHIEHRPISLVICPNNIKACRYKKHIGRLPPQVRGVAIPAHTEQYIMVEDVEGLLALIAVGTVELHGWGSRAGRLGCPDRLVFDLDPDEGVPWEALAEAVLLVRNSLLEAGIESFLKTTGGKGYHVVAPIVPEVPWPVVTPFTRRIAEKLAAKHPGQLTARQRKEQRKGRIFIDWIRNGHGTNAIETWSTRARHGAAVAVPISWEELVAGTRPDAFNLLNIHGRFATNAPDPWREYFDLRQKVPEG